MRTIRCQPCETRNRRGISTIWMILALPAVMTMFVAVMDVGHVWLARNELKSALDAAALSTVKTWGEGGTTAQARLDGNDAMSTNTVLGVSVTLDTTDGGGGGACVNGNPSSTGEIVLGTVTGVATHTFNCNVTPTCPGGVFGVRIRKTVAVRSICPTFLNIGLGPYNVTAESYARYSCPSGPPQLVHVDTFTCTCP